MNETFVVRIWTPSDAPTDGEQELQGFVEHVGEPGRRQFHGDEELLAAIRAGLAEPAGSPEVPR